MIVKESEARILIYLSVVPAIKKNLTTISRKLGMDYGFCIRVLNDMVAKEWVFKHRHGRFMSYYLTDSAPVEHAKEWYKGNPLQKTLEDEQ
jgi:DNA-binding MarR family transcriptional regulator